MRPALLLFVIASVAAFGYLVVVRGPFDWMTIVVAAAAALALGALRLNPPERKRKAAPVAPVMAGAKREELAELAGNLEALASGRFDGGAEVAVRLADPGRNQIAVIKVLRQHFKLGLKEAKDLTDSAKRGTPVLIGGPLPSEQARNLARDIEEAGGRVEFE